MKLTFAYGAATRQGAWPVQEDGYFMDPVRGFFALADGFGGRGRGDMAAKNALLKARAVAGGHAEARGKAGFRGPVVAWQRDLIREINKKSFEENGSKSAAARGGCSLLLVSADRARGEFILSSCGACGAALFRGGRWHSILSPQADPRIEADGALLPHQAIGLQAEVEPEDRTIPWEQGDLLFLYSSGVDWWREDLMAALDAQVATRPKGGELLPLVSRAAEGGAGRWNQTAMAVESLISGG